MSKKSQPKNEPNTGRRPKFSGRTVIAYTRFYEDDSKASRKLVRRFGLTQSTLIARVYSAWLKTDPHQPPPPITPPAR